MRNSAPRDPRDTIIRWLIGILLLLIVGGFSQLVGQSASRTPTSFAELAEQMNAPELANSVQFEAQRDGILICYIDAAWRQASLEERRRFALSLADRWAGLTGNPHALVGFGTGHGTFFAFAASRSKADGQSFYRALELSN